MMYKLTELKGMKARELQKLATSLGISHSRDLKKSEVIEAILGAEKNVNEEQSATDEVKIDDNDTEVVTKEKDTAGIKVDMEKKKTYVDTAVVGTLVAFKLPSGKVKSAKITRKSTKNRKFEVKTDYDAVYVISYDDVIWVRTGKRWPKGVYEALKGGIQ